MRKNFCLIAVAMVATLVFSVVSCSGGSTELDVVNVPDVEGRTKQAVIVMPGDLLDEAQFMLSADDFVYTQAIFNGTLDQRRSTIYINAAYMSEMYTTSLNVMARDNDATENKERFEQIADDLNGELITFSHYDFNERDWGCYRFASVETRQAAARLADRIMQDYSDTVWYVEFDAPVYFCGL